MTGIAPKSRSRGRLVVFLVAVALLACRITPPAEAQRIPSDASWETFDTNHFRVSFTTGIEDVARRAAARAERAYQLLSASGFPRTPALPIDLVVADNVDYANGNAITTPRSRIIVYAHPPAGDIDLGFHDDWMEVLVLHELTHIFHLESAGGIWAPLRSVFGRNPFLFPQYFAPDWLIEGLAIHFESAGTGAGRVRSAAFEMTLRTAALEGTFFGIDRTSFGPVRWPGGAAEYVYGMGFMDALARRHGAASLVRMVDRYGRGLIPYRLDASARDVFGVTFSAEWSEWRESVRAAAADVAKRVEADRPTVPEALTAHGQYAHYPRYSPVEGSLAYATFTGRDEPAMIVLRANGERIRGAWTAALGPASWTPDGSAFVYASPDYAGPNEFLSDLYLAAPGAGRRRLTRGARVWHPDVHPRGGPIVAVGAAGGTNVLVTVDPASGEVRPLTEPDPETYWSTPRWSPAGDRIAVGRWQAGNADIVVLDGSGVVIEEITRDRALDIDPTWSPNGRYILFGSDRTGIHNIYAWDTIGGVLWQVTNVVTGAFQPAVSPAGEWIAFSYYGPAGYDLARIPYDPANWRDPEQTTDRPPAATGNRYAAATTGGPVRPYSAWETVLPTFWSPLFSWSDDLGGGGGIHTSGSDVARRHSWSAHAFLYPEDRRFDGRFSYFWQGWENPVVEVSGSQEWFVQVPSRELEDGALAAVLRRDRTAGMSLAWRRPRVRSAVSLGVGAELRTFDLVWSGEGSEGAPALPGFPREAAAWLAGTYSTARAFNYSLGPQTGYLLSGRFDLRRREVGSDEPERDYWRLRTAGRAYQDADWFGFAPSVFALRLDAGMDGSRSTIGLTVGDETSRDPQTGGAEAPLVRSSTRFAVRGYPAGTQGGNRAVAGSLEYRFPIALVERGYRLLPVAVDRLWGDIFVDAGAAWCPEGCEAVAAHVPASPTPLVSAGAEVLGRLRLGYSWDLTLRAGVAVPLRETASRTPVVYLGTGTSF